MINTSNRNCRWYVQDKLEFKANNIFAETINLSTYCVYSYGTHWILYMWKNGQWLGCSDKNSTATNKHNNQANPLVNDLIRLPQKRLQEIKYE